MSGKRKKISIWIGCATVCYIVVFMAYHCAVQLPRATVTVNGKLCDGASVYRVSTGGYLVSLPENPSGLFVYLIYPNLRKAYLPNQSFVYGRGFILHRDSPPVGVLIGGAKVDTVPPNVVSNPDHFAFTTPYPKDYEFARIQIKWRS
jgi:hypothetical protein